MFSGYDLCQNLTDWKSCMNVDPNDKDNHSLGQQGAWASPGNPDPQKPSLG